MTRVAPLVALALVLAGCAAHNESGTTAQESSSSNLPPQGSVHVGPSDSSTSDAATGGISGKVVDDESRPLPNVTIGIADVHAEVRSSVDGLFTFDHVPVGKHTVAAQALGYESKAKSVEVAEGKTTEAVFELVPLPVLVAHAVALPHTFFIHLGVYGTSFAGGNTSSCESCEWIPKIEPGATYAVVEIHGKHTVPYPTRPDGLAVFIYKNPTDPKTNYIQYCGWIGADPNVPCLILPMHLTYNQSYLNDVEPKDQPLKGIRFWQWCDPFWFCVEERYDEWLSLFYDTPESDIPKDYSAWPK